MEPEIMNALLEKVLSDPDSDGPRIEYAEACEAVGDLLRARFIRLQLEAIHLKRIGDRFAFEPSLAARELSKTYGAKWAGPIQDRVAHFEFYRGFVEEVEIDARTYLDTAEELNGLAPIRKLSITGLKPVMEEFFSSPHLRRIVSLYLEHEHIGDEGVRVIARSPHLGKLVALGLAVNKVTLHGVEALAASTTLPFLKQVDFTGNPAEVVKEIVSCDGMDPRVVWADPSEEALKIEAKYGRKTWLHTVEDHGYRIPLVFAEC
jgi:uncharacterized protein (TIGR02996 family)